MRERERAQAGSDGICWWCTSCKTTRSIRTNSFFAKSKLTLRQWFLLTVWWAREYSVCTAAVEAEVTEVTSCQVYEWLREVCSTTLIQTSIILGGSGVIVQIDESQFRHKPKVYTRGITYICTYISVSTAPSWAGATTGCLGVWNGGHVAHTSLGVHGNGSLEECGYIASDNSKPCSPRDDHPLGSVAGVQPGGTTSSRLHSSHSEPFPPLRQPGNWRPHPTCGIVLESCEGEAETHEGLPPPPVAGVPR